MIVATAGAADANSFVTIAEADSYFAARFGSAAWDALSPGDKEKALLHSGRDLQSARYKGQKKTSTQALHFPRYEDVEIPSRIKWGQCEQALHLAQNASTGGRTKAQQLAAQGVRSFRLGDHSQTFDPVSGFQQVFAASALQYLAPFLEFTGRLLDDFETPSSVTAWPLGN